MPTRLPKINQLLVLQAVVKYGSINAAAKALNMAQPTLSRSIKELEETLGIQLMVRGTTGTQLTAAGRSFATNALLILEAMERAMNEANELAGHDTTRVRFGISPISAHSLVAPVLGAMSREFPNCSYHVDDNPIERNMEQVKNGFLDFAVGNGHADVSFGDFLVEPLFDCPFYIVCAKGHPLEKATTMQELCEANWWITGEHRVMERTDPRFKQLNTKRRFSTRSFMVGLPMVLENHYLALLSSVQINRFRDQLSVIPIQDLHCMGSFVLIRMKNVPMTTVAQRLITLLHLYANDYDFSLRQG